MLKSILLEALLLYVISMVGLPATDNSMPAREELCLRSSSVKPLDLGSPVGLLAFILKPDNECYLVLCSALKP